LKIPLGTGARKAFCQDEDDQRPKGEKAPGCKVCKGTEEASPLNKEKTGRP